MKNPKTKTKSAKSAGSKVNTSADIADGLKTPWKEMGGLPTVEQLALITATLARTSNENLDRLAEKAMNLWLAARKRIFLADFGDEVVMQNSQWVWDKTRSYSDLGEDPFLPTGEYPVTRDQFLQKMMPKRKDRTAELAQYAKAFIRDTLRRRSGKDPTQEEVSEAYGRWKSYDNADQANATAKHFRQWYEQYVKKLRSDAGKASAKKKAETKAKRAKQAAEKESRNTKDEVTEIAQKK